MKGDSSSLCCQAWSPNIPRGSPRAKASLRWHNGSGTSLDPFPDPIGRPSGSSKDKREQTRAGALGRPRGIGWGERREGGSGLGTHVNPWLIHVNVWQKPLEYCKVISLQLIKINEKKKEKKREQRWELETVPTLTILSSWGSPSRKEGPYGSGAEVGA